MKAEEVIQAIENIPLGSRIKVIKKNGRSIEVALQSDKIEGRAEKKYNGISIPPIPDSLMVSGPFFGDWRLEIDELLEIETVD